MIKTDSIFSDGTQMFRSPQEPAVGEKVTLRIRVAHGDAVRLYLCTDSSRAPMRIDRQDDLFDYYCAEIFMGESAFRYFFEIHGDNELYYYDRFGITDEIRPLYWFCAIPGFSTPDWAKGAVMYQILVDRFADGDRKNDVENNEYAYIGKHVHRVDDWNSPPAEFDVLNFYGGDLEGVRQKLYYLKSMGIEVIYFNPIFVSPSNHKYDTQDYDFIDPHIGVIVADGGEPLKPDDFDNKHATQYIKRVTSRENLEASNDYFAQFIREAHEKGIRVILDGVFNHCGSFNKWLDRERIYEGQSGYPDGAYISEKSPYKDFFGFYGDKWPYNSEYDGWWGHDTLPKLNYEGSETLHDYIIRIGRKWVSEPFNADGWRLDVAADLGHSPEYNHKFWAEFRDAVKDANPDAIILAEHYGDASSWLQGDQWDTVMNYDAFMEPVSFFFTGMEKHSDRFEPEAWGDGKRFEMTMRHCMCALTTPSLMCSMNQLSNHDHSRFLTRTNHKVGRVGQLGSAAASEDINPAVFKEAALMLLTWPGAPTIYYGDEAGQVGFTDPDNRRTYPWGGADYGLIDFHRDIIFMHRMSEALRVGSLIFLVTGRNLVSYARFTDHEQVVIALNSGGDSLNVTLPVWKAGIPAECTIKQILITNPGGYSIMPIDYYVKGGRLEIGLKPYSGVVLKHTLL